MSRLDILLPPQFLDCVWALLVWATITPTPMQCLYSHSVANYLHAPRMVNVEQVWVLRSHPPPPQAAIRGLDGDPKLCINKRWKLTTALRDGNH